MRGFPHKPRAFPHQPTTWSTSVANRRSIVDVMEPCSCPAPGMQSPLRPCRALLMIRRLVIRRLMISRVIDLDRGGHPGHESDALRDPVYLDAHGNSLREPHPCENWIDHRDPLP